jgi:hypothetical protein
MISPFEAEMFIAAVGATATVAVAGVVAWTVVKLRGLSARSSSAPPPAALEERLARMEQAIDALAVEMERSSESQRFTARLLAERLGELPGRVPDRALGAHRPNNTPH